MTPHAASGTSISIGVPPSSCAARTKTSDFTLPAIASNGTGTFLPELSDEVIDVLAESFTSAPPLCTAAWNDYHGTVTRVRPDAMAFPLRLPGLGTESAEQTAAAYGANFERLRMIKAKYDPDNFFRLNHDIRPSDR